MLWTESDDRRIAELDPLVADEVMSCVPQWNADADIPQLQGALEALCRKASVDHRNHDEVLAIIRDIGILVGSIRRHGGDPALLVPSLGPLLTRAAMLTELVPRDTLMHYTIWNPEGPRLRTYTDHPQEPDLIASIRKSLPAIREATRHLFDIRDHALHNRRVLRSTYLIGYNLKHFLLGLHYAMRRVEPDVFIQRFRPFFEPISINSLSHRGPGAVTMPLHVFDYLLWGSSEADPHYQQFTADYIPYNTGEFRQYYCRARNTPSFVDRLEAALCRSKPSPGILALLRPAIVCIGRVRAFRRAHLKYAFKAYHGSTKHAFATGSGGHTTTDLERLSELTDKHARRLESIYEKVVSIVPTKSATPSRSGLGTRSPL